MIIRALKRIPAELWRLIVVGDGPERLALEEFSQQLGCSRNIIWKGWVGDPWANLPPITAFVISSEYEGFPVAMLEAMARGLPVVATDFSYGPREMIVDGINGWLTANTEMDLSRQLSEIAHGRVAMPSPVQVAHTVARFSLESVVDKILAAIADVVIKM